MSEASNVTQTLSSLFEEMLLAEDSTNKTSVNLSRFLSALKPPRNESQEPLDWGALVRLVDGWRHKLNLTEPSEASAGCRYCEGRLRDVVLTYNGIHGYVSLFICVFGSLANALNVAVLTRRDLAAAPINRLLKWLAVADVCVMMEYIPFTVYRYFMLPGRREMPYSWALYLLFHMHFTQLLHTASICLTLALAVWRYVAIKYSSQSHVLCSERRCSIAILTSFLLPPVLCVPTYMLFDIHTAVILEPGGPALLYHVDSDSEGLLYAANFWTHAVLIKLLPCAVLTAASVWLLVQLYQAARQQKHMIIYNPCPAKPTINRQQKRERRTHRTTQMLVAVLILFLVTELPQGILGLLSGLLGRCFFKRCYGLFGELMDALALINGAVSFVLYCAMSRQFRCTFRQIVWRADLVKWSNNTGTHSHQQNTAKSSVP